MKIQFNSISKVSSLLDKTKSTVNKRYEMLHIDTENGKLGLTLPSFTGYLTFTTEKEDSESHLSFSVNTELFIKFLKLYENKKLTTNCFFINSNYEFSLDDTFQDTYVLSYLEQDFSFPDIEESDYTMNIFPKDVDSWFLVNNIKKFIDPQYMNQYGLFIKNGNFIATNRRIFIRIFVDNSFPDMQIPCEVVNVMHYINAAGFEGDIEIGNNEDKNRLLVKVDNFTGLFPVPYDMEIMDIEDPAFVESYNHDSEIGLDFSKFYGMYEQEIYPFLSKDKNHRFLLSFAYEEDKLVVSIDSIDEVKLSKKLEILDAKELDPLEEIEKLSICLDGRFFWDILYTLNKLNSDAKDVLTEFRIQFPLDENSPVLNFYLKSQNNFNCIQVKMEYI